MFFFYLYNCIHQYDIVEYDILILFRTNSRNYSNYSLLLCQINVIQANGFYEKKIQGFIVYQIGFVFMNIDNNMYLHGNIKGKKF